MNKKAAIYARVSSRKQKEADTIDSQVEALQKYAIENGYEVLKNWMFLDDGVTGESLQRPALDELRDMVRCESINAVLVYAPDRLARKYSYQLILIEEFRKHGVKVCFLKDAPVGNTPEAIMFNHFQGIFAEYERALILDRSRRGRLYKAKQGDPSILPDVPYGYIKVKKDRSTDVEVVPQEAEIVMKIFKMYIFDKVSLMEIARTLTRDGIKSPSGLSRWDISTIRDILNNPAYTGTAYYGKTERGESNRDQIRHCKSGKFTRAKYPKRKLPQDQWIPINIPQIISENDFEMSREQINKNKEFAARNTKEPALLQGLVMCGKCGNPFYKRFRKYKNQVKGFYYCKTQRDRSQSKNCTNGRAQQVELEELVYGQVIKLLKNPSIIKNELARRSKESIGLNEMQMEEIHLKKELKKLTEARNRLLDAYQDGIFDLKELSQRNQKLDTLKIDFERKFHGIQALKMEREVESNIEMAFENILNHIEKKSEELPLKEKQKLMRLFVEKVIVDENHVKIIHCISPDMITQENCQLRLVARN